MGLVNPIDDLTYNYEPDTNKLTAVSDNTNSPKGFKDEPGPTDYAYDANGNMISDANKAIDSIHYNHLNLPTKIYFQGGDYITYIYTAGGTKIRKDVHDGSAMRDTDYLDGYQYVKKEIKFFPTSEGYVSCIPTSGGNNYRYVYHYKDHLGNIRMCYGLNEEQELTILEENHYYPFGLKHTNYNPTIKEWGTELPSEEVLLREAAPSNPVATSSYKYKFNGVEWQDDLALNLFDMDMRDYDPAIGRWLGIDPVTHHSMSPYNGMDNNPVSFADPSGSDSVRSDGNGGYVYINAFGMSSSHGYNGYGNTGLSAIFGGFEDSRQNDHGYHEEDFMTTTDAGEILNVLLTYGSYATNSETAPGSNDFVSTTSQIYKDMQSIGVDANSPAPLSYASIDKIFQSKNISSLVKGANFVKGDNLIIDFKAKTQEFYGQTVWDSDRGKLISYIYPTAFATWARLAMTVPHEGVHQIDYSNGLWSPKDKNNLRAYQSELKAWKQNERLGDVIGAWQQIQYQRLIDNLLRH
ncbi:RHS repeat domain-containing protein [Flavobacterium sp.]|uniref:RHS repeat domain-containing protein n=1 Tax=Flavobacterium sp. TaxID=239 RepID=UPI0039E66F28